MLNYVDQGAIASNGVTGSLRTCLESGGDFNLSNFQDGVLSSAFMFGLLVASPIFASLAKSHNPFRLIRVGLSFWTFPTAGCGSSFDFWSIAICRMLVGVGEASSVNLAAPFIDDNAPVTQKTAWLVMFYMCIPTGVTLGDCFASAESKNATVGPETEGPGVSNVNGGVLVRNELTSNNASNKASKSGLLGKGSFMDVDILEPVHIIDVI